MLSAFDEYPVENFHSLLRAKCSDHDSCDILRKKAKEVSSGKDVSSSFQFTYVVPTRYTFSRGRLEYSKVLAAKFLTKVFQTIKDHPHVASKVPRSRGKCKNLTYWKLPQLYGEENIVSSKILPLGYQFPGKESNTIMFVKNINFFTIIPIFYCYQSWSQLLKYREGGNQARWVWQSNLTVKKLLTGHTGKGRSLGALIRNV